MAKFLLIVLAIAGAWIALYVLWFLGELWRGRHLPKLLVQGLAKDFNEYPRVRRAIESRLQELEAHVEPAHRLSDRDRLVLVGYALNQWILFDRRTASLATTREARIHDLTVALRDNFRGTFSATSVITKDWESLTTDLATVMCDHAATAERRAGA